MLLPLSFDFYFCSRLGLPIGADPRFSREADTMWKVYFKEESVGTSLVVQWFRLCLPMQGVRVQSLVRGLRSHMLAAKTQNIKNRSNIVTNSIKTLKKIHKHSVQFSSVQLLSRVQLFVTP